MKSMDMENMEPKKKEKRETSEKKETYAKTSASAFMRATKKGK